MFKAAAGGPPHPGGEPLGEKALSLVSRWSVLQPEGRDPGQLLSGIGRTRRACASTRDGATAGPLHRGSRPPGTRAVLPSGTLFTLLIVVIEQGCLVLTVSTPHCRNPAFPLVEVKQSSFVLCKRVLISPFHISEIMGNVFMLSKLETLSLAPKPSILKAPFRKTTDGRAGPALGPPWPSLGPVLPVWTATAAGYLGTELLDRKSFLKNLISLATPAPSTSLVLHT